ncbi:cell surface glycoprotein [Halodesulfurarchaeum formicicum]|uniref:Cell surface glycoprotein n=2 Tax=Halodesulfurarchaeum formicicum TaxID=1873524 RepID=A0A1D8S680_9EURY|nr:cell surface glycoprotein [Halodesulfurarchaeum formicicum]
MTEGYTDQARAIFLAALMVLSIAGGSIAFAGSAAAQTNSISLSDDLVAEGDVQVNGSVDANGTVVAFIDENGDGEFNTSDADETGISDTEYIGDVDEDNEFSISLNTDDLESGTYDVYVFQEEDVENYGITNGDTGERSAELQVDADAPVFGNETPEAGTTISAQQDIVVPIEDANTSVDFITATVTAGNEEVTLEINPGSATDDGVEFADNELTISPGTGGVPAIGDDTYTVDVTAEDEVGNQKQTDFKFTIDGTEPDVDFVTPDEFEEIRQFISSDENQTIEVDLEPGTGRTLNDSTAELEIEGANGYEETLNNSFNGYSGVDAADETATFKIDAEDDISALPDGQVTLTASVEDDIGNSVTESRTFEVDLDSPNVTSIELTDDEINISDRKDGEDAIITFDEPVDEKDVSVNVNIDGSSTTIDTNQWYVEDENGVDIESQVAVPLEDALEGVTSENDSAVVNVTAAADLADDGSADANTLGNADADASNTTFDIDTNGPSVTLSEPGDVSGDLQGYVNATAFVSSQTDVDQRFIAIEAGGNDDEINTEALVEITDTAENVDTVGLPDGDHRLFVYVEDDAGNSDLSTIAFDVDNGKSLDVAQDYLSGIATPYDAGTQPVDVDSIFTDGTADHVDVTYSVNGEVVSEDDTINAAEYRGQQVDVNASAENGQDYTVQLQFAPLVGAESVSGDTIDIGVQTDAESLDELNVTVEDVDNHFWETERQLTREDFTEYGDESGIYTATTVEGLDDGKYKVTVTDAEDAHGDDTSADFGGENGDSYEVTATVDDHDPELETAYVIDSYGQETQVKAEFNEAVTLNDDTVVTFRGSTNAVEGVQNNGDGTLTVELEGEVQTADAPLLNVTQVSEANGDSSTTEKVSTEVATANIDLSSDKLNVISVPAETGEVPLSDTELSEDEETAVWAYAPNDPEAENGWLTYSPGADDNTLDDLVGGQGYVVNVTEDTTVEINAQNVPADEQQALQSQTITEGWNLIGHYQENSQSVGQALTYLDTTYDVEEGYTGMQVDSLQPGQGYWVFSNGEGVHAPVNYGGAASERPNVGDVQVSDADGVLKDGEEVQVSATVQANEVINSVVAKPDYRLATDLGEVELTDENNDGKYTGTFTTNFSDDAEPETKYNVRVEATDVDGNFGDGTGESPATDSELATAETVTNLDTGVTYNTLTGALSEVKEFETLELSDGKFVENRDSLTITTDNLGLVGNGTEYTKIAANVELAGSDIHVEGIDYVANSPTGDVTVTGEGTTLETVGSEGTISIDADSVTVSNSNAKTISVNANSSSISNTVVNKSVDVGVNVESTSMSNVEASEFTGNTDAVEADNPQPADGKVLNVDTLESFDEIQAAVDAENTDVEDTLRVGAGTYESVTIDVGGLTLEGPNAGLAGDSDQRGAEASFQTGGTIDADNVTIDGFELVPGPTAGSGESRTEILGSNAVITNSDVDVPDGDAPLRLSASANDTVITQNQFANGDGGNFVINARQDETQLIDGVEITDNTFEDLSGTGTSAIQANGFINANISGNSFDNIGEDAVRLAGDVSGTEVTNNEFSNYAQDSNIAGGNFDAGAVVAVSVSGDVDISGNQFNDAGGDNVYVNPIVRNDPAALDLNAITGNNTFNQGVEVNNGQIVPSSE